MPVLSEFPHRISDWPPSSGLGRTSRVGLGDTPRSEVGDSVSENPSAGLDDDIPRSEVADMLNAGLGDIPRSEVAADIPTV